MNKTTFTMNKIAAILAGVVLLLATAACNDGKSYAEQLTTENKSVNLFLANHKVIDHIPADSVFEVGSDAPYYALDNEGNIYMQVLNVGDGERPYDGQKVYFRYMRYPLTAYPSDGVMESSDWNGNANNVITEPTFFKFDDYSDYNSSQYGTGIQQPLHYLNLNCEVNLVVKSQYGFTGETSYVIPFLYNIRYFKSQL